MALTQVERLIAYLREHPGASSLEITLALKVVNVTGRISDIRKFPSLDVECRTVKGVSRYWLVQKPVQAELGLAS